LSPGDERAGEVKELAKRERKEWAKAEREGEIEREGETNREPERDAEGDAEGGEQGTHCTGLAELVADSLLVTPHVSKLVHEDDLIALRHCQLAAVRLCDDDDDDDGDGDNCNSNGDDDGDDYDDDSDDDDDNDENDQEDNHVHIPGQWCLPKKPWRG
jgi:hypothetical protein